MTLHHFFLFCFLTLSLVSCSEEASDQIEQTSPERTTNVSTYALQPDSLVQYSRLSATANAWHDITISALESGVVTTIYHNVGDQVKRGDHLAQLNLELLQSAAIEANANLKFQTYNYERSQKLFSEGSISEQTHFATEYDYFRAKSMAQTLQKRLAYGKIRAPFSGNIAARHISKGQLVPQGGATFRLVQADSLRITAWVAESEVKDFKKGNPVTFTLDALPGQTFAGYITHIGPASDSNRRVFPIEVHLPNHQHNISPGMVGTLKAVRRIHHNVVVIPREAILERETGPVAFVVEGDQARLRQLELGASEADRVVVNQGLAFGAQLIVKGGRDLIDGDRVVVKYAEKVP